MKKSPTLLVILDGYGYSQEKECNAIYLAKKPTIDYLIEQYPSTIIQASGKAVGLPDGYVGNSEVGHLTIGCGRVIEQPISFIDRAIKDETFFSNEILTNTLKKLAPKNTLHIMGLLSDAGVHSDINHLYAYIKAARACNIERIVIHAFLDGRDTPPQSAATYLTSLETIIKQNPNVRLGSMHGRFYAMDRDTNWNRIKKSYELLTTDAHTATSWHTILSRNYQNTIYDEFVPPTWCAPDCAIKDGDGIIFFNIRSDRARQLTIAFVDPAFNAFATKSLNLAFLITPVDYGKDCKTTVLFKTPAIKNTLKAVLNTAEKTMLCIAETEKYAHVTYFFAGGKEEELSHETRVLITSIKAKNYVATPCMSAEKITQAVLQSLNNDPKDFYLINYANADMVGHSGNLEATIKAIECLDKQLQQLYATTISMGGTLYVTADHGNAEQEFNQAVGQPSTSHTTNPVPFIMIKEGVDPKKQLPLQQLADIALFILQEMGIVAPKEMDHTN